MKKFTLITLSLVGALTFATAQATTQPAQTDPSQQSAAVSGNAADTATAPAKSKRHAQSQSQSDQSAQAQGDQTAPAKAEKTDYNTSSTPSTTAPAANQNNSPDNSAANTSPSTDQSNTISSNDDTDGSMANDDSDNVDND